MAHWSLEVLICAQRGQIRNEQAVEHIVRQRSFDGTPPVKTPPILFYSLPLV